MSSILRLALALLTLLLAQSAYWSPNAPPVFLAGLTGLALVTWWRPSWGLVGLALAAPLGRMIAVVWLGGYPLRGAEAMVLAFLAGVAVHGLRARDSEAHLPSGVTGPWMLFAAAAVASAAVLARTSQVHVDFPDVFLWKIIQHLTFGFQGLAGEPRLWLDSAGFGYLNAAVFVVEGVALLLITARLCTATPRLAMTLVGASVVAGATAAMLSMTAVAEAALASGRVMAVLPTLIFTERWAAHVNKVNVAGSHFVMTAFLAVVLARRDGVGLRRPLWMISAGVILIGLWLTASLAAAVGGAVVVSGALAHRLLGRASKRTGWLTILLLVGVLGLTALRTGTREAALLSLEGRVAITSMSLATAAERPVFGVGIGTYPQRSFRHRTDMIREVFGEGGLQAHNELLQIGAELGIVGLALFLWGLWTVFASAARSPAADSWARPAALASAAFLVSSLSGQPMLADSVAVPAWIVMGIALSGAPSLVPRATPARWIMVAVMVLAGTVPLRMAREVAEIDPRRAGYGTSASADDAGRPIHYLDGPARLFVGGRAVAVELTARAPQSTRAGEVYLEVSAPGLTVRPIPLLPDSSRTVCLSVAPEAWRGWGFRPIDVRAVMATGIEAAPQTAWAAVVGLDQPCGPPGG